MNSNKLAGIVLAGLTVFVVAVTSISALIDNKNKESLTDNTVVIETAISEDITIDDVLSGKNYIENYTYDKTAQKLTIELNRFQRLEGTAENVANRKISRGELGDMYIYMQFKNECDSYSFYSQSLYNDIKHNNPEIKTIIFNYEDFYIIENEEVIYNNCADILRMIDILREKGYFLKDLMHMDYEDALSLINQ